MILQTIDNLIIKQLQNKVAVLNQVFNNYWCTLLSTVFSNKIIKINE